jgi:hypothetical protein
MKYLLCICADGQPAPEDMAVMRRECPSWVEEMDARGVRLLGRELESPKTAATVRVRDGEALVSDGPFAETKATGRSRRPRSTWRASTCSNAPTSMRRSR